METVCLLLLSYLKDKFTPQKMKMQSSGSILQMEAQLKFRKHETFLDSTQARKMMIYQCCYIVLSLLSPSGQRINDCSFNYLPLTFFTSVLLNIQTDILTTP